MLAGDEHADALIRSRIQHHGDAASYVFAGSHPGLMAQLFGDQERPLYGQSHPIRLSPLDDEDLAAYVGGRFEQTGKDDGEALPSLLATSRGHPQRAMLLAHHLWRVVEAEGAGTTPCGIARSRASMKDVSDGFEQSWGRFSVNERRTLTAIAWAGVWGRGDSLFSNSTLARFKLSKGTARDVRISLLNSGELMRDDREEVVIVDPLWELWIASSRRAR